MKKMKPSVKAVIVPALVLTSTAAITYAVPQIVDEKSAATTEDSLKLEVERVDSDTVKVSLNNVQDIPKSLQFSVQLDGVIPKDGQGSIKDLITKEIESRQVSGEVNASSTGILTDFTYNEGDNTIDVLVTSNQNLPKTGNKIEIFELDVEKSEDNITDTYKVLPYNSENYKYVSATNKEYNDLGVAYDNRAIKIEIAPLISSTERSVTVVEGTTLTAGQLKSQLGITLTHEDGEEGLKLEMTQNNKVIEEFSESTPGIYELQLTAVKGEKKSEAITVQVNVKLDAVTDAPKITRDGQALANMTLDGGSTFIPLENVKATDAKGRDVSVSVKVDKNLDLDPNQNTDYTFTYTATDIYGNTATETMILTVVANQAPVISGIEDVSIKVGDTFDKEAGVVVTDDKDEKLELKVEGDVNTKIPGTYKLSYSVTDSGGKTTRAQRTVTVYQKTAEINQIPIIIATDVMLTAGDEFEPLEGVTAYDYEDKDITKSVKVESSNVDRFTAGTYKVVYIVTDSKGATARKEITVTVNPKMSALNSIPTITAEDRTITVGDEFNPLEGVTAYDNEDLDLTNKIEVIENNVDTTKLGDYTVTYSVTDSGGAIATKVITVIVKSDITLATSITIANKDDNKVYVDGGKTITASVNKEADLKDIDWTISDSSIAELRIVRNEARITAKAPGEVSLTAKTTDGSNLIDTITIHVVDFATDSEVPEHVKELIDMNILTPMSGLGVEESPLEFEIKDITADQLDTFLNDLEALNYQVLDIDQDDNFTIYKIKVAKKFGLFKLFTSSEETYMTIKVGKTLENAATINEKLGQLADDKTQTENEKPVITVSGENQHLTVGDTFDPYTGVTAFDKEDGDLTSEIKVEHDVDTTKAGTYQVTYTVKDSKGLEASVTVKVIVSEKVDNNTSGDDNNGNGLESKPELTKGEKPVITLTSSSDQITVGDTFDPLVGIQAYDKEDGNLTTHIKVTGEVNTQKAGRYQLTYRVEDKDGNVTTFTRIITVVEKQSTNVSKPQTGYTAVLGYIGVATTAVGGALLAKRKKKEDN